MPGDRSDVLQGTLDPIVLTTPENLGSTHDYGMVRFEQKGSISSEWGESENKRRARFYSLTKTGKKQLREETANWERFAGVMQRVLRPAD